MQLIVRRRNTSIPLWLRMLPIIDFRQVEILAPFRRRDACTVPFTATSLRNQIRAVMQPPCSGAGCMLG
jgi:hypothetical protein